MTRYTRMKGFPKTRWSCSMRERDERLRRFIAAESVKGNRWHLVSMAAKDAVLIDGGIPHAEDLLKAAERFGRGASSAKPLYIVPSQAERMLLLRTAGKTEGII